MRLDNLPSLYHIVVLHQGNEILEDSVEMKADEEAGFALVRQDGLVSQPSSRGWDDHPVCLESTTDEEVGIAFIRKGSAGVPASSCTFEGRFRSSY